MQKVDGAMIILLLSGSFSISFAIRITMQAHFARNSWLKTLGHISRCFVRADADGGYSANVEYEYIADGKKQKGKRLNFGGEHFYRSRSNAEKALAKYQPGSAVEVLYNPFKPSKSVLIPTASWINIRFFVLGLFFLFGAYLRWL